MVDILRNSCLIRIWCNQVLIIVFIVAMDVITVRAEIMVYYTNPIMNKSVPDPTVVADESGGFYMYGTNQAKKVPIYFSQDLVSWRYACDSFDSDQMPEGLEEGGIWAPDVIRYDGRYLMSYSYSKWGEEHANGIGLAIANSPEGPFKNLGMLFTSDEIGVPNSIDPSFVVEKDKLYLLWGSFHGLFIVELARDSKGGYKIKDMASKRQLAGTAFEGSHIFKRGKYYYLFASVGRCCSQDKSTYRVVVGRSKNLFGPYVDSDGVSMLDNGYNLVVSSNEKFVGPGHGSKIITDKDGKTWYIYHSYVRGQGNKGRLPMLDEIKWTPDGWPYIYKGTPSTQETVAPKL